VSIETEIKIRLGEIDPLRRRLIAAGAVLRSQRHFEDNFVLDFPDGRLRSRQSLLRVRYTTGGCFVTFKGPPRQGSEFKIREELETILGDAALGLTILRRLGLEIAFRYQKYREEYVLARELGAIHAALDETPIGNFTELEGAQEDIRYAAGILGFSPAEFLKDSYYGLYSIYCEQRGQVPQHMVFPGPMPETVEDGR
jgi:adenylate cyclase, class 2